MNSEHLDTRRTWRPKLSEWLAIFAIVAVLIALLLPQVKWVADGDLNLPVKILVFDAVTAKPIADAKVVLFRASPWGDDKFLNEFGEGFTRDLIEDSNQSQAVTDANGEAEIPFRFSTGASHRRPISHAHTSFVWAAVRADGYGGSVVQLRPESVPTQQLRQQKELRVAIGLMSSK